MNAIKLISLLLVAVALVNAKKDKRQTVTLCPNQDYCRNQAICYVVNGANKCVCAEGYTGTLCETFVGVTSAPSGCSPNPCQNGATCVTQANGAFMGCFCRTGYIGTYCQTQQSVITTTTTTTTTTKRGCGNFNPCRNGSTCVNDATGGFFGCVCPAGFTGATCETAVSSATCTASSCLNGGICVQYSSTEKWCNPSQVGKTCCQCRPGYTGLMCETDIDECASSPCKNGGVCTNLVNAYRCTCPSSWTGVNCETSSSSVVSCSTKPCGSNPCLESPNFPMGYICQCGVNDFRPNCPNSATTTTTASSLTLCSEQSVCRNQGVCYIANGSLRCVCPTGYTGQLCESLIG